MLIEILDANRIPVVICAQAQGSPVDRSGTIATPGTSQALMPGNVTRSGWFVQNTGQNTTIRVNDLGGDAAAANAVILLYGESFPPPGYPVTTAAINITGDVGGGTYSAREW